MCFESLNWNEFGIRGRPFDSGGGWRGWNFLEINILTLKMLKQNSMSNTKIQYKQTNYDADNTVWKENK